MWWKTLSKWNYKRRYKAALVVYIGAFAVDKFDADTRDRIESEMNEELAKSPDGLAACRRWGSWYEKGAFRATAMRRLGIEPPVYGLSWSKLLRPWKFALMIPRLSMSGFTDFLAGLVLADFRLIGQPTEDARQFLVNSGINIPDEMPLNPYETDDLADAPHWIKDINKLKKILQALERKQRH